MLRHHFPFLFWWSFDGKNILRTHLIQFDCIFELLFNVISFEFFNFLTNVLYLTSIPIIFPLKKNHMLSPPLDVKFEKNWEVDEKPSNSNVNIEHTKQCFLYETWKKIMCERKFNHFHLKTVLDVSWISHTWLDYSKRKHTKHENFCTTQWVENRKGCGKPKITIFMINLFSCIWFSKSFSFHTVPCNSVLVLNWVWMFVCVRTGVKGTMKKYRRTSTLTNKKTLLWPNG